jgi:N4-(beta-N-acetylglucosaminyl)-L-asparaginase
VDGDVGAAGSTGRGVANLFSLASFLIVELMRNGQSPKDAGLAALKRVAANTVEQRLRNTRGQPNFNVTYYIVNAKGEHAGVSLYESSYALCTGDGPRTSATESLFKGKPTD